MLFLSRKVGESLVINDTTRITVMEVKKTGVKLGVECPSDVRVHRKEVYDRIEATNQEAVASGMALFSVKEES